MYDWRMSGNPLAKFTQNKAIMIGLATVVGFTLIFGLDSFVRRKKFDPADQIEDYAEGRVTFNNIAEAWRTKDTSSIAGSVDTSPGIAATPEARSGQDAGPSAEEVFFFACIEDYLPNSKTIDLDRLVFSSPGLQSREGFVNVIRDLCGHRIASVTIDHDTPVPVDMPVDKQGNKLQYAGTVVVEFARDDLPEVHMDAVTFSPKTWKNPIGRTSDGLLFLIPVADVIFKT